MVTLSVSMAIDTVVWYFGGGFIDNQIIRCDWKVL